MKEPIQWHERKPLHRDELKRMMKAEGFRDISEIFPRNPNQSKLIQVGTKVEIMVNNGLRGYYTITALTHKFGDIIEGPVGRDESGLQVKGEEFVFDSSMGIIWDVGYKVVDRFPWEGFFGNPYR